MSDRIKRRKKAERRLYVLCWSLAAVLHVGLFVVLRQTRITVEDREYNIESVEITDRKPIPLDLFFGPPAITNATGGYSVEPPERVLEVDRLVYLPGTCRAIIRGTGDVARGSVRLKVNGTGRVDVLGVERSTGFPCGDATLTRVAGDLWYRWLPSEEFPAPVELVQPLSFAEKVGP